MNALASQAAPYAYNLRCMGAAEPRRETPGISSPARSPRGAAGYASQGRIRIVCLIGELGHGGSERQLQLLLEHLDPVRFECRVIVFNRNPQAELIEDLEHLGIRVEIVPPEHRGVARRFVYLYRTLRRLRPHVVHSWTALNNPYAELVGWLVGATGRFGSLRTTLSSSIMRGKSRFHRWLILHGCRRLVVNSRQCAGELAAAGIGGGRVLLLPNCVCLNDHEPANVADLGIEPSHRLVGMVGNLKDVKNPLFFVDAMARILPDFPDLRVLLVGQPLASEPDLPRQIEERIDRHSFADRFVLTGFRPDVPALLRRMDVCCLTSRAEGMPNAILEAMAAGRPVVATRVGGVPELVSDGDNGFLIEPGDDRGFAEAVSRLLRQPELARRMGRRGHELARQRHGCEDAVRRLADLYLEALGR